MCVYINDCGGLTFIQACFTSGSTNIYKLLFAIRYTRHTIQHSTNREFLCCYFCFYFFLNDNRKSYLQSIYIAVGLSFYLLCTISLECMCVWVCILPHTDRMKKKHRVKSVVWARCKSINKQWHNFCSQMTLARTFFEHKTK